jgi:MFS family permease
MELLHTTPLERRPPHPFAYTVLIVPFGASGGFVTVALAYLATKFGLTVEQGAELIAVSLFPNVWKFFWAPIGDRTLTRKRWYVLSCVACALGVVAMAAVPLSPSSLHVMDGIILVTSVAATFLGFSVEGLVAHITPENDRGRVSGWFQAGNLGGTGIGGGIGLMLLNAMPGHTWVAGAILGALMLLCAIPLLFVGDVGADRYDGKAIAAVRHILVDMWQVVKTPQGILCSILCFVPVGTGAAQGVLTQAEVAAAWGAHEHEVELVQGFLTGGVSMVGCLVGGYACSKLFDGRVGYAIFGGLMALTTVAMAYSPATPTMYIAYNLAYAFVTGLCYAAFSAFVLDAIGKSHAATKYNGFASLSNTPIWYVGLVLAKVESTKGPKGMLLTESGLGVIGILFFMLSAWVVRRRFGTPATEPAPT